MATQAAILALRKKKKKAEDAEVEGVSAKRKTSVFMGKPRKQLAKVGFAPSWYPFELRPDEERVKAATKLQAIWRGHKSRQYSKRVFQAKVLVSEMALRDVIQTLKHLHYGWKNLCCHVFFLVFLCVVIFLQLFAYAPSAFSVESALRATAIQIEYGQNGDTYENVETAKDVYDFTRAAVSKVFSPDPYIQRNTSCDFAKCSLDVDTTKIAQACGSGSEFSAMYNGQSRVLFGLLLVQRRYSAEPCIAGDTYAEGGYIEMEVFQNEEEACMNPKSTAETFNPANPFVNESFVVFGQKPFQRSGPNPLFFSILDVGLLNLDESVSQCAIDQLEELEWIDRRTKEVCVVLAVKNRNGIGRYGYFRVCFGFDVGGLVTPFVEVQSASIAPLSEQTIAIAFTGMYVVVIFFNLVMLFHSIWQSYGNKVRRCCSRFCNRTRDTNQKLSKRPKPFMWMMEACMLALHLTACVLYFDYIHQCDSFQPFPIPTFQTQVLVRGLLEIDNLIQAQAQLRLLYSVILILMVFRSLGFLDFHPDTAIVSRTLSNAYDELFAFFLVFITVVVLYAFVGVVMFSSMGEPFRTFGVAVQTLLFSSMSDFGGMQEIIEQETGLPTVLVTIYFWSFIFLTTLILFNILLSIVVEAFVRFQDEKRSKRTIPFFQSLLFSLCVAFFDIKNYYVPCTVSFLCHCKRSPKASSSSIAKASSTTLKNGQPTETDDNNHNGQQTGGDGDGEMTFSVDAAGELEQSFEERKFLNRLRNFKRQEGQSFVPTFEIRKYLHGTFPSQIVERILWMLRERTVDFAPSQAETDKNLFFRENEEMLYIIDLIREVLRQMNIQTNQTNTRARGSSTVVLETPPVATVSPDSSSEFTPPSRTSSALQQDSELLTKSSGE